ncbi:MAG: hypothetical protein ACTSSH_03385 [Candidatus Heimdallarchaeota archaeon]
MSSIDRSYTKKRRGKVPNQRQMEAKDKAHTRNFIIFEIGFIVIAIPLLIVGFSSIPFSMYYAIVKDFRLWPLVFIGAAVAFFQILAMKYFVKRFFLDPYNMTLGQYLRMRYDERFEDDEDASETKIKVWYENLDEFIIKIKEEQKEQTYKIYTKHHNDVNISF